MALMAATGDPLVQGSNSNFYGTTYEGGMNLCDCGTIFKITSDGNDRLDILRAVDCCGLTWGAALVEFRGDGADSLGG